MYYTDVDIAMFFGFCLNSWNCAENLTEHWRSRLIGQKCALSPLIGWCRGLASPDLCHLKLSKCTLHRSQSAALEARKNIFNSTAEFRKSREEWDLHNLARILFCRMSIFLPDIQFKVSKYYRGPDTRCINFNFSDGYRRYLILNMLRRKCTNSFSESGYWQTSK